MIAVSEVSWLTDTRPDEIEQFWNFNYAEIDTISNKIKKMEETGYTPVAHFILPEYCWLDCFYKPMQENIPLFLEKYKNSTPAQQLVQRELDEIDYYRKTKVTTAMSFISGWKINKKKNSGKTVYRLIARWHGFLFSRAYYPRLNDSINLQ